MPNSLSYDDVLIEPGRSPVESRSDIDISTNIFSDIELDVPLISAPMDSVTGVEMAQTMADLGGVGIIHRFCAEERQGQMVSKVDGLVGASIGIGDMLRADKCIDAGADFICIDVAHGHLEKCLKFTKTFNASFPQTPLMVGNVATYAGAGQLYHQGADCIKLGVGSGSHCTTRIKTGVGVPQFSAVKKSSEVEGFTIADGGIRNPGDAVKALMAGANAVMMGGEFGRCEESPHEGVWGMASEKGKKESNIEGHIEGQSSEVDDYDTVENVVDRYTDGIKSGLSYIGGHTIGEARRNVFFHQVTPATMQRNGAFIE